MPGHTDSGGAPVRRPARRSGDAARACRRRRRRSPSGCARAPSTSSSARTHLLARGLGAAHRDRVRRAPLGDLLRAAGHRQDDAGADHRRAARGRSRRTRRSTPAGPRCATVIERAEERRARHRPADDLLPRRDPPLQQGPAGRAAAGGRGGPGDADRGDHREPLLRGQLGAALAARRSTSSGRSAREEIEELLRRALARSRARHRRRRPRSPDEALELLAARSGGDARVALAALERAVETAQAAGETRSTSRRPRTRCSARRCSTTARATGTTTTSRPGSRRPAGSDADASLYYLAVMLEGGEDPRFIARRMVIFASEDVGNADPQALVVANAAAQAVDRVGLPECAPQPRPGGGLPGAGAEVERLLPARISSAPSAHVREHGAPSRRPTTCRTPTTRGAQSSAAARATSTRTTSPAASPTSRCSPEAVARRALLRADRPRLRGRAARSGSGDRAARPAARRSRASRCVSARALRVRSTGHSTLAPGAELYRMNGSLSVCVVTALTLLAGSTLDGGDEPRPRCGRSRRAQRAGE